MIQSTIGVRVNYDCVSSPLGADLPKKKKKEILAMFKNNPFVPRNQKTTTTQRVNVSHSNTSVLALKMLANLRMHTSIAIEKNKVINVASTPTNQKLFPTPIRVHRLSSWLPISQYDSQKGRFSFAL